MLSDEENERRRLAGEEYYAFLPALIAARTRCTQAVNAYNDTRETSRRHRVELWRRSVSSSDARAIPPDTL